MNQFVAQNLYRPRRINRNAYIAMLHAIDLDSDSITQELMKGLLGVGSRGNGDHDGLADTAGEQEVGHVDTFLGGELSLSIVAGSGNARFLVYAHRSDLQLLDQKLPRLLTGNASDQLPLLIQFFADGLHTLDHSPG